MEYRLISADSHFIEPPNLWTEWLPQKYQDIAPKLCKDADGGDDQGHHCGRSAGCRDRPVRGRYSKRKGDVRESRCG